MNGIFIMIVLFCIITIGFDCGDAGKEKVKDVKKKPVAVTDPKGMRSLQDWTNLGKVSLRLSCEAIGLPSEGSTTELATRLHGFYYSLSQQSTSTGAGSGMYVL